MLAGTILVHNFPPMLFFAKTQTGVQIQEGLSYFTHNTMKLIVNRGSQRIAQSPREWVQS